MKIGVDGDRTVRPAAQEGTARDWKRTAAPIVNSLPSWFVTVRVRAARRVCSPVPEHNEVHRPRPGR